MSDEEKKQALNATQQHIMEVLSSLDPETRAALQVSVAGAQIPTDQESVTSAPNEQTMQHNGSRH